MEITPIFDTSFIKEAKEEFSEILGTKANPSVFIPTWDNRPEEKPAVLSLNGVSLLSHQNVCAVIASPGVGKSSICEAVLAYHLNPSVDCLGIEGDPGFVGAIYVDFERTNLDVWNSFYRMAKRAQIPRGSNIKNVKIAGLRAVPRLNERLIIVEELLKEHPCSLLILDGAGDLVTDPNDLMQAVECRIWMREITVKYNLSIFTTLHPNPNSEKPRGHIGSEICREAESVLLAKSTDGDVRILTSDFEHGKTRNGPSAISAFQWDDEVSMFISTDVPLELSTGNKPGNKYKLDGPHEFPEQAHLDVLKLIFKHEPKLTSGNFISALCSAWNSSSGGSMGQSRAKEFRSYYVQSGFITATSGQSGNKTINELNEKYKELVK